MSTVVLYDRGAASPTEILRSLGPKGVVVVCSRSDEARRVRPLFAGQVRAVVDWTGDAASTCSQLRGLDVRAVVTFSERMVGPTALLAARLGLPGHDPEVARRLGDKACQRSCLREAGLDSPPSTVISDLAQWWDAVEFVGLPAVVKPACGEGSRNTVAVHDARRGRDVVAGLLRAEGRLVVEQLLTGAAVIPPFGDYVSVETVLVDGRRTHLAVTGKFRLAPPFRESGQFWPDSLDPGERTRVVQLVDRSLQALGVVNGITHTEVKLTPAGPALIEVNGRLGGHVAELARRAVGLDLIRVAAEVAAGDRPTVVPVAPDGVFFQYSTPGPVRPGTLRETVGGSDVRALPQVSRYQPYLRPGDRVGGTATRFLELVCGQVRGHEDLARTIDQVTGALSYRFDVDGGCRTITRTAADLLQDE